MAVAGRPAIKQNLQLSLHDSSTSHTALINCTGLRYRFNTLLGHINRAIGKLDAAKKYYQTAMELAQNMQTSEKDLSTLSFIYQQLCLHSSGNNTLPLKNLTPLLEEESLDTVTQITLHRAFGNISRSAADWHGAKSHFKTAIQLAKSHGHHIQAMECKAELGRAYRSSGCHSKALKRQKKLLEFALQRGDTFNVASACGYVGFTYYSMGEEYYDEAVKYLYCKLKLCKNELDDLAGYRWCLNNIGKVYLGLKKYEQCMKLFGESADIAKQQGNSLGVGTAYGNLGSACRAVGKHDDAVMYHKLYLQIAEKNSDTGGVAIMQRELILDHLHLYKAATDEDEKSSFLAQARNCAFQALKTSLEMRSRLKKEDDLLKIGNFEHNQAKILALLLFVIIQQGQYETALLLSELGRAHALADRITDKFKLDSSFHSNLLAIIGSDDQIVASSVATLLERVGQTIRGSKSHLLVYSMLDDPLQEGNMEGPLLYTWHVHQPPNSQGVQVHFKQAVLHLPGREKDYSGYITGLVREIQLSSSDTQLPTEPEQDDEAGSATVSRDIIRRKNPTSVRMRAPQPKKDRLEALYDLLIAPVSQHIFSHTQQGVRLIVIPHGFLFDVPFCALKSQGSFLIEKCVISISPSLYLLDVALQREKEWDQLPSSKEEINLLAIGNPEMPHHEIDQLPGAESEIKSIHSLLKNTTLLSGVSATKEVAMESLSKYSVVHLATHAIMEASLNDHLEADASDSSDVGDYSVKGCIILAKSNPQCSGVLTSLEIENLHLTPSCELVVLSCCNTARGKITGDGILGLSRALMCAGVTNILVTLWRIHDASTAELMKQFYQHYITSRDAAASLQAAMVHLIQENYSMERWAAFCCIGTRYGI